MTEEEYSKPIWELESILEGLMLDKHYPRKKFSGHTECYQDEIDLEYYYMDFIMKISVEEYEAMKDRVDGNKKRKNKYNAKKTSYNGNNYDSKKEAKYAESLDLAMKYSVEGAPEKWERQIRMPVKINDKHICYYILDFKVYYKDRIEYIDVKGMKSGPAYQMFRLKKKLVEAYHGIEIIEK